MAHDLIVISLCAKLQMVIFISILYIYRIAITGGLFKQTRILKCNEVPVAQLMLVII